MGRPTSLDADTEKAIVRMVRNGNRLVDACAAAGIGYTTLKVWMQKGAAGEQPYKSFRAKLLKAKREAKTLLVEAVMKGGRIDPKVGIAILERRYPKEWARQQRLTLDGNLGVRGVGDLLGRVLAGEQADKDTEVTEG